VSKYTTAFHLHSLDSAEFQRVSVFKQKLKNGFVEAALKFFGVPLSDLNMVPDGGLTLNGNHVPVYLLLNTQLCLMEEYWFFICITTERNESSTSLTQQ
jgi:hypothetical protein